MYAPHDQSRKPPSPDKIMVTPSSSSNLQSEDHSSAEYRLPTEPAEGSDNDHLAAHKPLAEPVNASLPANACPSLACRVGCAISRNKWLIVGGVCAAAASVAVGLMLKRKYAH